MVLSTCSESSYVRWRRPWTTSCDRLRPALQTRCLCKPGANSGTGVFAPDAFLCRNLHRPQMPLAAATPNAAAGASMVGAM